MDSDGQNEQRLTDNPYYDWHPKWSPDGDRIFFESRRDGNPEIYVMDANGDNEERLTQHPGHDTHPALGIINP